MLTIVIPAYNHERYVLESLQAACLVDLPGTHIVVIDDGSSDSTREKVESFLKQDVQTNVTFITKSNGGLVSSLILGLEMAKTEYMYIVASDDIPSAAGIKECIRLLEESPGAMFCVGGAINYFGDKSEDFTPVYNAKHDKFFSMNAVSRASAIYLNYPQPILLQSTIFRVSALKEIGGWDKEILLDDYPTFIKMLGRFPALGQDFLYCPQVLVVKYRQHETNSYKNVERQFFIVKQMLDRLAPVEIYSKALGKVLAMHFLGAMRLKHFREGFRLFNGVNIKVLLSFFHYLAFYVFRFVMLRLKRSVGSI
jgi:cellulose synthase/poly-beta-1,6-N-acetylglucosamine synthase-like glycosyltransferase